jgi:hypothetical protein
VHIPVDWVSIARRRGRWRRSRARLPETRSAITRAEPELIVQPSVPWPVLRNRPLTLVGPITGVPSGRHRSQARPEARLRHVAAGEEVGDGMLQRQAARFAEVVGIARDFRHAADADAVAQAGDGDLVGLVHHRRFRRARGIGDRDGQRIALDRIDRQAIPVRRTRSGEKLPSATTTASASSVPFAVTTPRTRPPSTSRPRMMLP